MCDNVSVCAGAHTLYIRTHIHIHVLVLRIYLYSYTVSLRRCALGSFYFARCAIAEKTVRNTAINNIDDLMAVGF